MTTIHPAIDKHPIPRKDLLQALVDRHGGIVTATYDDLDIVFERDGFKACIVIDACDTYDAMHLQAVAPHGRLNVRKEGDHFDFDSYVYIRKTAYSTPETLITESTAPFIFAQFEDILSNRATAELERLRGLRPWKAKSDSDLEAAAMVISGTTVRPPRSFKNFCCGPNWDKPVAEILDQPLLTAVTVIDVDNRHGYFVEDNLPGFKDNPSKYDSPEQRQAVRDRAIITPTGFQTAITARTWRELLVAAHAINQKAEEAYERWRLPYRKRILLDGEIATISNQLWDV